MKEGQQQTADTRVACNRIRERERARACTREARLQARCTVAQGNRHLVAAAANSMDRRSVMDSTARPYSRLLSSFCLASNNATWPMSC